MKSMFLSMTPSRGIGQSCKILLDIGFDLPSIWLLLYFELNPFLQDFCGSILDHSYLRQSYSIFSR